MGIRAIVAMSGGVDSSVAACLMAERGYECLGVTMKLYENETIDPGGKSACRAAGSAEDAGRVACALGIPHCIIDFSESFRECVMERFVSAYASGLTPNPCIDCNLHIKFGKLFMSAKELGCDVLATGHYARIERDKLSGRYLLKKGKDSAKDQSYVLYMLSQEQLSHIRFPLGELKKDETRRIAREHGLIAAEKSESQDICFVPGGKYSDFIRIFGGREYPPGDFIDTKGNVLGRHRGIVSYTIGQRRGLGLSLKEPMYVLSIDPRENTVTLGREADLFCGSVRIQNVNLVSLPRIEGGECVTAKLRYRQREQHATLHKDDEETIRLVFDQPQRAPTPGQAAVFYQGDAVAGGGTIV